MSADEIIDALYKYSKYPVPQVVNAEVKTQLSRYGKLKLERDEQGNLVLASSDKNYVKEILRSKKVQPYIEGPKDDFNLYVEVSFEVT